MTSFQPLALAHRPLVNDFLQKYPPAISELTFTNLYVWRHIRPVWVGEVLESVVFLIDAGVERTGRKILFGPPVGPAGVVAVLDQLSHEVSGTVRIPEDAAVELKKAAVTVYEDRDNFDYVYKVSDLATLKGRFFSKKRNHVKQCLEKYDCHYEPITAGNIDECVGAQERWCNVRNCSDDPGLCGEFKAIMETFAHFEEFGLLGGAIRINEQIEAFAIGEALRPSMAVWHFEKAMPGFQGLGQLINKWFSEKGLTQFTLVNREQDLGIKGLRQAKESYQPDHLIAKYNTVRNPPHADIAGCT